MVRKRLRAGVGLCHCCFYNDDKNIDNSDDSNSNSNNNNNNNNDNDKNNDNDNNNSNNTNTKKKKEDCKGMTLAHPLQKFQRLFRHQKVNTR